MPAFLILYVIYSDVFEVEFSDRNGRACAIETLNSTQLLVLHHQGKELMIAG